MAYLIPFPSLAPRRQHTSIFDPPITGMGPLFPTIMHAEAKVTPGLLFLFQL